MAHRPLHRPLTLLLALSLLSCATVTSRPFREVDRLEKKVVSTNDGVQAKATSLEAGQPDLLLDLSIYGKCQIIEHRREGTKRELNRWGWDAFFGAAALAGTLIYASKSAACNESPLSCRKTQTASSGSATRTTYSRGEDEAETALTFAAIGAPFWLFLTIQGVRSRDDIQPASVPQGTERCEQRPLTPSSSVELRVSTAQSYKGEHEGRPGLVRFKGARRWLLEHPEMLKEDPTLEVNGLSRRVAWKELFNVDGVERELRQRREEEQRRKEALEQARRQREEAEALRQQNEAARKEQERQQRERDEAARKERQRACRASAEARCRSQCAGQPPQSCLTPCIQRSSCP